MVVIRLYYLDYMAIIRLYYLDHMVVIRLYGGCMVVDKNKHRPCFFVRVFQRSKRAQNKL